MLSDIVAPNLMNAPLKAVRQRSRALMRLASALGAQKFDAKESLVHTSQSVYPDRCGFSIGQHSLEYAIALLETGGDSDRADRIVNRVLDFQVRDAGKLRHGNFIWYTHWKTVKDANAIYFILPNLMYLWNRHRDKLGPKTRRRLRESWPLCVHGMQRHRVDWSYSNIFLLGVLCRFLLAPWLPKTDLDEDARNLWRAFLKGIAHFGITEYNSPTYSPVCIYALEQLWAFGPRDLKPQFETMLEYFYFEFAGRYHAPSGYLAGVMSRAYPWDMEPRKAFGAIVAHLQWGEPYTPQSPFVANWLLTEYVAPESIRRIAMKKKCPLEIRAESAPKSIVRTDYLDKEFTVASQTGGWYGDQQVPLFATVRGDASGRALYVEPSMPFAARLTSKHRGAEVLGEYLFDAVAVHYQTRLRESKSPPSFHEGLAFRWHLGSRELVQEVRIDGRQWDGNVSGLKQRGAYLLRVGHAWVALRIAVTEWVQSRQVPSLRLQWRDDHLSLDVIMRAQCGDVTGNSVLPRMLFRLQLADAGIRSRGYMLRRLARLNLATPASQAVPSHVIHHSSLADIRSDDLLGFFLGRSARPWEKRQGPERAVIL